MGIPYSKQTDEKWQKRWEETGLYRFDETKTDDKFYLLEMFSYPSGRTLHIGHWWNYALCDTYGRLKRMQGRALFHPPGFDAFGLPAENYAIETGRHPFDSTRENIAVMERQFRSMGTTYDWNYEVITCDSGYYRWTQWLFLQLFYRGLAFRQEAPVNFCPSCHTVLANEQAAHGVCERCGSGVIQRNMTQWFFKITDYADELLRGLDKLNWPEITKKIQRNWIGKSEGFEIYFQVNGKTLRVFTTRLDTLFGVTALVLSPEHPFAPAIISETYLPEFLRYRERTARRSELDRLSDVGEKTGVFTGAFAGHPLTGQRVPVWISDYVLPHYGTGAVMAVPAHDARDYAFACRYGLPILPVVTPPEGADATLPMCGGGILTGSGIYSGLSSAEAGRRIAGDLKAAGLGRPSVRYRLRDWLVSRQRYFGTPIPIIHCPRCGTVPVPEEQLPVELPRDVNFMPGGESPLAASAAFLHTRCPRCGGAAERETDTLDTFVCSSWYYLRFFDNQNSRAPFDPERLRRIMPVDMYVGGVEHAAMHLLYARFVTKALRDMGFLSFGEPFPTLVHQGTILGSDGKKMSKRKGALSPDAYVNRYGSDVLRLYLCFGFSYLDGGPWNDGGIKAVVRFVGRVCRIVEFFLSFDDACAACDASEFTEAEVIRDRTAAQVSADIGRFSFNTAVARLMEYSSAILRLQQRPGRIKAREEALVRDLIILLAPLAPHLSEELWEHMGYRYSVHSQQFPTGDAGGARTETMQIAVQVNGMLREVLTVPAEVTEEQLREKALLCPRVRDAVGGKPVARTVYVPGRIINFVCR